MPKYSVNDFNMHFKFINARIDEFEKNVLIQMGLPISRRELSYIALVGNHPRLPLTRLVEQDSITKSTFSNQIKTLEQRGYVQYEDRLVKDKREKHLLLTASGEAVFAAYKQMRQQFFDRYLNKLTDAELRSLHVIGAKLVELMAKDDKHKPRQIVKTKPEAK